MPIPYLLHPDDIGNKERILALARNLKAADYRYSLRAGGYSWDVYAFQENGRDGLLAVTIRGKDRDTLYVGFCRYGFASEAMVLEVLKMPAGPEA